MLFPCGLALVLAIFPLARGQMAIGIWAATGGMAGAFGPSVGALLIDAFGWRAVFLINVPVAIVAVLVGWRVLIESRAEGVSRKVDVLGVPLASLGVGALVLGIVQGRDWGWGSLQVIGALAASVVLIVGVRGPVPATTRRRCSTSRLFRIRSYRMGLVGALLFSAGFFGSWVLLPTFIQRLWGWSVLKTGFALHAGVGDRGHPVGPDRLGRRPLRPPAGGGGGRHVRRAGLARLRPVHADRAQLPAGPASCPTWSSASAWRCCSACWSAPRCATCRRSATAWPGPGARPRSSWPWRWASPSGWRSSASR